MDKTCPKCGAKDMIYEKARGKAPSEYICKNCGRVVLDYHCTVCGCALGFKGKAVHAHYVDELAALLERNGYTIITEGGIPKYSRKEWARPDIFVLKELAVTTLRLPSVT